jgi:hypothetical protein
LTEGKARSLLTSRRLFALLVLAVVVTLYVPTAPSAQEGASDASPAERRCRRECRKGETACVRRAEEKFFGTDASTQELEVFAYCRSIQENCEDRVGLDFDALCTDVQSCMREVRRQLDEKMREERDRCDEKQRACLAECA